MIDLLQWPAMVITVFATWLVGSTDARRRRIGFWVFLISNLMWATWAVPEQAWALLALQLGLAVMNVRGYLRQRRLARETSP